jgi:tripartite-type tricarboxylate transporter receptor subunit TctC
LKRQLCKALLGGVFAALATASSGAWSQSFPTKPIRFILPFAPGGVADITARILAQKMSENLRQQVVVENRPGAGMIGSAQAVMAAQADGHIMVVAGNGTAISTLLFKKLPFDVLTDFIQLSTLAYFDLLMVTSPDSRFKSVADVISYARANPGKLNVGTISIGSTQNLTGELFRSLAKVDMQIIPFKGSPEMILGLRSNSLDIGFEIFPAVISQVRSNGLRLLATAGDKRLRLVPNAPTIAESGVPGFLSNSWNGISTRSGTPRPLVDRLSKEINVALEDKDVIRKMAEVGAEARGCTPEEARKLMIETIAKWKKVIEDAKIPLQG